MPQKEHIDFSVLKDTSLARHPPRTLFDRLPDFLKIFGVVGLFVLFPIIFLVGFILLLAIPDWLGVAVFAVLFVGVLYGIRWQQQKRDQGYAVLKRFAADNGWKVGIAGATVAKAKQYVSLAKTPGDPVIIDVKSIQGMLDGVPFEAVVASSAWTHNTDSTMVTNLAMYLQVPKQLPRAVLISRDLTDGSALFDRMFTDFTNAQKVTLEGDFNKKFQLYIPKDTQVDALSLVAPDFMHTASEYAEKYVIKLEDDMVCLISRDYNVSASGVEDIIRASQALLKEM